MPKPTGRHATEGPQYNVKLRNRTQKDNADYADRIFKKYELQLRELRRSMNRRKVGADASDWSLLLLIMITDLRSVARVGDAGGFAAGLLEENLGYNTQGSGAAWHRQDDVATQGNADWIVDALGEATMEQENESAFGDLLRSVGDIDDNEARGETLDVLTKVAASEEVKIAATVFNAANDIISGARDVLSSVDRAFTFPGASAEKTDIGDNIHTPPLKTYVEVHKSVLRQQTSALLNRERNKIICLAEIDMMTREYYSLIGFAPLYQSHEEEKRGRREMERVRRRILRINDEKVITAIFNGLEKVFYQLAVTMGFEELERVIDSLRSFSFFLPPQENIFDRKKLSKADNDDKLITISSETSRTSAKMACSAQFNSLVVNLEVVNNKILVPAASIFFHEIAHYNQIMSLKMPALDSLAKCRDSLLEYYRLIRGCIGDSDEPKTKFCQKIADIIQVGDMRDNIFVQNVTALAFSVDGSDLDDPGLRRVTQSYLDAFKSEGLEANRVINDDGVEEFVLAKYKSNGTWKKAAKLDQLIFNVAFRIVHEYYNLAQRYASPDANNISGAIESHAHIVGGFDEKIIRTVDEERLRQHKGENVTFCSDMLDSIKKELIFQDRNFLKNFDRAFGKVPIDKRAHNKLGKAGIHSARPVVADPISEKLESEQERDLGDL